MLSGQNKMILYDVRDSIARITLNRPDKRNALNPELIAELKVAVRAAVDDEKVRVAILSGVGKDFCAGADLSSLQKISGASVNENLTDAHELMDLFVAIREARLPVIAGVRGRALAGGCGLALACDLVLAGRSARFGFPEVKIGFVPAMVMAILRRNVSEKKAFEMIALGEEIPSPVAESLGLINRVTEDSELDENTNVLAQRLARLSASALSLSKALLHKTDSMSFVDALESGADMNVIARMSEDCRNGIQAFFKKQTKDA